MMENDGRPLWDYVDSVARVVGSERLTPVAEKGDIHVIQTGSQKALRKQYATIFNHLEVIGGFADSTFKRKRYRLIRCIVEQFYANGGAFGSFEVLKLRPSATRRQDPEIGVTVEQSPARPEYLMPERCLHAGIVLNGVLIPGDLLKFAYQDGASRAGARLTELIVPRLLRAREPEPWSERWYTVARPDFDHEALLEGVLPAQSLGPDRMLRLTPILTLTRYAPTWCGPHTMLEGLSVEFHPGVGMPVSLRTHRMTVFTAMMSFQDAHPLIVRSLNGVAD